MAFIFCFYLHLTSLYKSAVVDGTFVTVGAFTAEKKAIVFNSLDNRAYLRKASASAGILTINHFALHILSTQERKSHTSRKIVKTSS